MIIPKRIVPLTIWLGFVWALLPFNSMGQPVPALTRKFSSLTTLDGLSQSTVNCILKDRLGFLWFGTQDGLNRYDGYSFTVYRNRNGVGRSLPDNQISCLAEDPAGNLWVGTLGGGLCYYDRDRDAFYRIEDLGFHPDKPLDPAVLSLHLDKKGQLWVGTFRDLLLLDLQRKSIRHFTAAPGSPSGLSSPTVQTIFEDTRSRLWIGTNGGLDLFNPTDETFTHYLHNDKDPYSLSSNKVVAMTEDDQGRLWIGTNGGGLNRMEGLIGIFTRYRKNGDRDKSLSGDVVRSLCPAEGGGLWVGTEDALDLLQEGQAPILHYRKGETSEGNLTDKTVLSLLRDSSGIVWVGTSEGGVNKYDKNIFYFDLHRRTADPYSLGADMVTSFAEADNGDIWIGTDGGGLCRWQRSSGRFIPYPPETGRGHSPAGSTVLSLLMNRKRDHLWIGTYGNGLVSLDMHSGAFHHYQAGNGPGELSNASIYALLEDRAGNIWMGTNGGGVDILNPATGNITRHRHTDEKDSISNDYIRCLLEDRTGNIWIGTYSGGISVYDPHSGKFKVYNKMGNNLSNQVVYSLYEDAGGNIWAGTMGGGLNLFDAGQGRFTSFTEEDGLSNNIIHSIQGDTTGHLWLSTNKGISRFTPATRECRNYGIYHGLQNPEFIIGSGYRTSDGHILFGGVNGFNIFYPDRMPENKVPPVCRFTGFFLFNKAVEPGGPHSVLDRDINNTASVTLTHDQSDFTVAYAALNYTAPAGNRYAYMLEGFDRSWINAGDERRATYTNLAPGTYRLLVKASNHDGVWNNTPAVLVIHITPPFWNTWWAWLLYVIGACVLLYVVYMDIVGREKLKARIRLQQVTADQARELNRIKLNFFTNVSHELRTPLSLIMDPLRKILREKMTMEQVKQYSSLMFDNAHRLMKLIDQLLDLRKLEEGHLRLDTRLVNIAAVTRNVAALFEMHAEERNIRYSITTSGEPAALIDQDKFEKVIFNLLSNAFKYTPDNGRIDVLVAAENGFAVIHVRDTGVGIPAHLKDKVFEIFYQVEGTHRFESGSAGIGLALTKELVELHGGHITVESQLGQGSDFIVYLPLESSPLPVEDPDPIEAGPQLLLVEDNKDLRNYLKQELGRYYKVEDASDGNAGYEKAVQWVPDLVISDIMMPGISGLELCRKIKTDERTSHIPVVLLTARQADVHQIEGYSAGADAYIPKPFNMELVLARIENLLATRQRLRELYRQWEDQPASAGDHQPAMNPMDKQFLDKAIQLVEQNMEGILFDTDVLADKLKVSRRQLYRKLKALTDQTVHDFITGIRMKKAAELLLTGDYNISEVAYKVGYSEPANFSRSFTRWSGKSPRKYIAGHEDEQPN